MPIFGTPKTRLDLRGIIGQVGGPYDTKTASEASLVGELIICDEITEIEEDHK